MAAPRFFEDLSVGQRFGTGTVTVEPRMIEAFAAEFDPQPFHLSDQGAKNTIFRALAASGWHTAAITMRLLVDGDLKPAGGIVGFDELRWPRPVRAGDELHVHSEILDVRASTSHPDQGVIKVRTTTMNQAGDTVQIAVGNLLVRRRGLPAEGRTSPA